MGERPEFEELTLTELRDVYAGRFDTPGLRGIRERYSWDVDDDVSDLRDDAFWCYWLRAVWGVVPAGALTEVLEALDTCSTADSVLGHWLEKDWLSRSQCDDLLANLGSRSDYIGRAVRSRASVYRIQGLIVSGVRGALARLWRDLVRDRMSWALIEFVERAPIDCVDVVATNRLD